MIEVTIKAIATDREKKEYKIGIEVKGFGYPSDPNTSNISNNSYAANRVATLCQALKQAQYFTQCSSKLCNVYIICQFYRKLRMYRFQK